MKPTWDRLMDEFKDSKTALVADVDCTVHEDLCSKHGVEGYPTIKYGDPGALQDYQGGREFEELLEFAKTNLGPTCGLKNLDLCSEEQKKEIETVNAMTDEQLVKGIEEKDAAIAEREKKFQADVEALQKSYDDMQKAKDADVAEIKKSGLSMLRSVCKDRPTCTPPAPPAKPEDEEPPPEGEEPEGEEPEDAGEDEPKDEPKDEEGKQDL